MRQYPPPSIPVEAGALIHAPWSRFLHAQIVHVGEYAVLAVWLDEAVEMEIDDAWINSPSHALALHDIALSLCMRSVREHIPEIGTIGCAPYPAPDPELARLLAEVGLPAHVRDALFLSRRYAVVTPYPFAGGCLACFLRHSCPRIAAGSVQSNLRFKCEML